MSNQFTNVVSYRVLAQPVMLRDSDERISSVSLTTARTFAPIKQWTVTIDFLCQRLSRIIGKATTAELIECLRAGQIMSLPGTYTVYQIVQMGYRKTVVSPRTFRKAGTR